MNGPRKSALVLIVGFLVIIFGVPAAQVVLEIRRGEPVQYTDVFRQAPTEENLRAFEATLEGTSWGETTVRPATQWLLFAALRDTGSEAVWGRDGWLFYRPGVRYLVEPDRPEKLPDDPKWQRPGQRATRRESVVRAIVGFRDQLEERGIRLLVVPVPQKASVYPDMLTGRMDGAAPSFTSPTVELIQELRRQAVDVADLFATFREQRRDEQGQGGALYLAHDTHWTPEGAKVAAGAVAQELRALGLAPDEARQYTVEQVTVERHGDIVQMTQIPGLSDRLPSETVVCERIEDAFMGPLIPAPDERPGTYRDLGQSPILVLGDSFCRIYQLPEPKSLGDVPGQSEEGGDRRRSKRLLPGSAGFVSHLAKELAAPVDYIVSDGGSATEVRRVLATSPLFLDAKRVVVWEFAERDIALGAAGWEDVPLPAP